MSYTGESNLNGSVHQREREMLLAGFSYTEIAQATGGRIKSISERNRLVYQIDIRDAFVRRIEREGIPVRLNVTDAFGYWFSGFFDGEGCLGVMSRRRKDGYFERRLGIQIMLRDDDVDAIRRIKDNLKIGLVYETSKPNRTTNPKATFRVEKIQDLAEIIIPLFEKYPLYTKKGREFTIWKRLVVAQYVSTLGGYSQRTSRPDEYNAAFDEGMNAIREIRTYSLSTRKAP
ncbi:MAG: LAGLIDADG family homing endonuclease [Acidobacteriota bacterium]